MIRGLRRAVIAVSLGVLAPIEGWAGECPEPLSVESPRIPRMLADLKAQSRMFGIPDRLISLLDKVSPVCPKCIQDAPTHPTIIYYTAQGTYGKVGWTPSAELTARRRLRNGDDRAFYITWMGPCACCGKEEYEDVLPKGGPARPIRDSDGIFVFDDPEQLADVTELGGRKLPLPDSIDIADPNPPRYAQPLCPACAKAADAVNAAATALYQAELAEVERHRRMHEIRVEIVKKLNLLADAYHFVDRGEMAYPTFKDVEERFENEIKELDEIHTELSWKTRDQTAKQIAIARRDFNTALARAKDCEERLCLPAYDVEIHRHIAFSVPHVYTSPGYVECLHEGVLEIEVTVVAQAPDKVSGQGKYRQEGVNNCEIEAGSVPPVTIIGDHSFTVDGTLEDGELHLVLPPSPPGSWALNGNSRIGTQLVPEAWRVFDVNLSPGIEEFGPDSITVSMPMFTPFPATVEISARVSTETLVRFQE